MSVPVGAPYPREVFGPDEPPHKPPALPVTAIVFYLAAYQWLREYPPEWPFAYQVALLDWTFFLLAGGYLVRLGGPAALTPYLLGRPWPRQQDRRAVLLFPAAAAALSFAYLFLVDGAPYALSWGRAAFLLAYSPWAEEVLYWGCFLGVLLPALAPHRHLAVWLTALIFAAHHPGTHGWGTVIVVLGAAFYGYAYLATRWVPVCVLCHALWNANVFFPGLSWHGLR